jgi:hypothetical protein
MNFILREPNIITTRRGPTPNRIEPGYQTVKQYLESGLKE